MWYAGAMPKPPLLKLSDIAPGQHADFFALLAEKTPRATRDGKPFYAVRFRDPRRSVGVAVWADSPHFDDCKQHWLPWTPHPPESPPNETVALSTNHFG